MILTTAERYIFIIFLVLIVLAYSSGGALLAKTAGPQAANLLEVIQGRDPNTGNFGAYPANAPTG